jgi:hypothetical protein
LGKQAPAVRARTVRGVKITTYTPSAKKRGFSLATVGNALLFGDEALVARMIVENGAAKAPKLASEPAYTGAIARAPSSRQLFAFLNGGPFVKAFNSGLREGMSGPAGAAKTSDPSADAFARFLGIDAIRAGSLAATFESETLAVQAALEIDRSKPGLVTVLSDPPGIGVRSAEFMPAKTDMATIASLDLVRLYDLVVATATPEATKSLGMTAADGVKSVEAEIGMKLRDELLASFGNEFALGISIEERDVVKAQDPPAKTTDYDYVGLFEVRDTETLNRAITKLFAPKAPPPGGEQNGQEGMSEAEAPVAAPQVENYQGVPLFGSDSFKYGFLDGFAILGDRATTLGVVDARRAGAGLATDPAYGAAAGTIPENTIFATYLSSQFFEWAAKSAATAAGGKETEIPFPNGLFVSVQKDASGVFSGFRVPIPNLRLLLEKERKKRIS